jgi:hypothetical protein
MDEFLERLKLLPKAEQIPALEREIEEWQALIRTYTGTCGTPRLEASMNVVELSKILKQMQTP